MKRLLAMICAAMMLFSVTAFAEDGGEGFDAFPRPVVKEDGNLKVGFIHATLSYEFTVRLVEQCKLECAQRGYEYVDGLFEQEADARDVWKTLINEGCDVIIATQMDNFASYTDMIEETRNAGIGLYSCMWGVTDGIIADATLPGGIAAMELAYYIGQKYNFNAGVAILTAAGFQVHLERGRAFEGILNGVYPDYKCLDFQDVGGIDVSLQNCYDFTQAWKQQYGDELKVIFASNDAFAISAAEAIIASGDPTGEKTITAAIEGGNDAWAVIREDGPFKISYAQPTEQFMHETMELVEQIQVKGLNPGDEGCSISKVGETRYFTGGIVTSDNLPEPGSSIHSVYPYYTEPENPDAWYNWCPDGFEIYTID